MLCRRRRRQDQGTDRTNSAAVARCRRAPAGGIGRVRRQNRARSDAGIDKGVTLPGAIVRRRPNGRSSAFTAPPLRRRRGNAYIPATSVIIDDTKLRPRGRAEHRGDLDMTATPLMPKATAVWLVENTALSFDQVADFCKLHPLEVKAIADGDAAQGIKGLDPVLPGQLSREEIEKGVADPDYRLRLLDPKVRLPETKRKSGPRYTPVSRRQDRPNAILWLVRNHPELKDAQIMRLVGTTKSTIAAIRERTHWNATNLQPMDPVTLGLCSQIDLDLEVHRAAKEKPIDIEAQGATLLPASETTLQRQEPEPEEKKPSDELNVDAVFAKLKQLGGKA